MCFGVHRSSSEILQRQKRNWIIDSFTIDEGYEGPFPYSLGKIQIEKNLVLFKIHGQGVDEEPKDVLQINEYTGEITVHCPIDYEKHKSLKLVFQAINRTNNIVDTRLGIEITIIDGNDNPPMFEREKYEITIQESTAQGTEVITVSASDNDTDENNKKFYLKILSVTPQPHDLEFYLTQINGIGTISFKGCLDYESAEKYTIIVEAKDHGEKKKLSSSCTVIINIEDGNNHIPVITGQTGPNRVKEREEKVIVSRLQVTDKDTKGTAAWRAKYHIHEDTNNNFRITTDPETNEGLLYVEKSLNYEDGPMKSMTISVENEIPYYTCKVVRRKHTGLWEVTTTSGASITSVSVGGGGETGTETSGHTTHRVTVTVEDINEAPIFDKPNKQVTLGENIGPGQYLETFTARDPDVTSANTFEYRIGDDPADWITVDPVTGKITTSKSVDRESPFVKDNIYKVTIYAVDNGIPPMTATATLSIFISDENDNTPTLAVSTFDMCQSDGPSLANITALDLDGDPYGGPFSFNLLGDVEGKWRVDPSQGYSVNLVKESTLYSGHFELLLEVSDRQQRAVVHNLSVTVCDCLNTDKPNCRLRKATGWTAGTGAFGILFLSILLLAGALLLAFFVSCKNPIKKFPEEASGHLIDTNTEIPGTDCTVNFKRSNQGYNQRRKQIQTTPQIPVTTLKQGNIKTSTAAPPQAYSEHALSQTEQQRMNDLQWEHKLTTDSVNDASQGHYQRVQEFTRGNSMRWSMGASSTMRTRHLDRNSMHGIWMRGGKYSANTGNSVHHQNLLEVLNMRLHKIYAQEKELAEDVLHVYDKEEDTVVNFDLDAISISDISLDPDMDLDLHFKFKTLASVCMPSESSANSAKTSSVMEKLEKTTLTQVRSQKTIIGMQSHL
ncbi:cadherin-like protein 26 isoform 2-T2 [Symphorus nematophorus]